MNRYLLDTNHLSAYLDNKAGLDDRINAAIRVGDRFGICLPVLCEYRAGIRVSKRFRRNLSRLNKSMDLFRLWPAMANGNYLRRHLSAVAGGRNSPIEFRHAHCGSGSTVQPDPSDCGQGL